eukprot:gene12845-14828_t
MSGSMICPDLNAEKQKSNVRFRRNSTSTIFATETVSHPDILRTLYYIAYIWQADLFEAACAGMIDAKVSPWELIINPELPANLGGDVLPHEIPREVLFHETAEDPILRAFIEAGTLPTVDTIFRFLKYYSTNVAPPTKCSNMAFLYIKQLKGVCNFTAHNWRGLWIGAMIIAQKEIDMLTISTSRVTTVLPGVNTQQLLALENKMFQLLNRNSYISPSAYIQTHLNLRLLFNSVLQERQNTDLRPLHPRSPIVCVEGDDHYEKCRSKSEDSAAR